MTEHLQQQPPPSAPRCTAGPRCECAAELQQLREEVLRLREQVRTDALTGLSNFCHLSETLPIEMERTRRSGQTMALILLDIDHFKQFNDKWGHELGNRALVHVAHLINLAVRKLDVACRFGGEEFVLILPNTDLVQAVNVAERLREMIESSPLDHDSRQIPVTASLGVDEFRLQDTDTAEAFLKRVDAWLYRAKDAGRNRTAHPDLNRENAAVSPAEKAALFSLWDDTP